MEKWENYSVKNINLRVKSKKVISFVFIIILILNSVCFADARSYSKIVNLKVENDEIIVKHHHDWSEAKDKMRNKMMNINQNPFTSENDYAYLECIEKKTMKQLFKKPTPALTKLYITNNSEHIIGLSNIMLDNPYQLVIFNLEGNLIYKKHIAASEAKLTLREYQAFKKEYQTQYRFLKSLDRITVKSKNIYIDFDSMNMPFILEEAWNYLIKRVGVSHLSKNFSESITNWIFWYMEPDPEIQAKYKDQKLIAISLLDRKGERFEIPINEQTNNKE